MVTPKEHGHVHLVCVVKVTVPLLLLIGTVHSFSFKPGYKLQDGVEITTEIVSTWLECFVSCQARKGCQSVEIVMRFRLCRLSSSDMSTVGTRLIRSPGVWYSEKREWAETSIDQRCLGHCSVNERCIIDHTVTCKISECAIPQLLDNSSVILGSQLSVGSNILHVCPDSMFTAGSVCEIDGQWSLQQLTCPTVGIVCPDGWEKFEESCYLFDDTFRNFMTAEDYCRSLQARLVHVESSEENMFLRNYLSGLPMADYWIGMTDDDVEGQWKWHGINVNVQFFDWYPNEAKTNYNENCAVFGDTIGYTWADVACGSGRRTVCEMDHAP